MVATIQQATSQRLGKVREWLAQSEAHALLVSDAANRRYLSGFTGSAGWLFISSKAALLLTDFRYTEQAGKQAPHYTVIQQQGKLGPLLADLCRQHGVRRLAFESQHVSYATYQEYTAALGEGVELVPSSGVVERLRMVKDAEEITAIRKAVQIGDMALAEIAKWLKPGMTEKQVAWRLEVVMREAGAEGLSFPPIVARGPSAAMPHHRPSDDMIQRDEFIILDFGCVADGYCSDMTRTLVLGKPSEEMRAVYRLVLHAQLYAEAHIHAGMTNVEADALARDIIKAAGHGDHFGHGLGHGVGLQIHEAPRLSPLAEAEPLPPGVVVSVEPGIYLPNVGGVRIEDLVVVRHGGVEVLTQSPKAEW